MRKFGSHICQQRSLGNFLASSGWWTHDHKYLGIYSDIFSSMMKSKAPPDFILLKLLFCLLRPLIQQTVWVVCKPLVVEQEDLELFQVMLCQSLTNVSHIQLQHSILWSHPCHLLHICSWSMIGWHWMVFSVFMYLISVPLPFLCKQLWVAWLDFSLCLSLNG